MFGKQRRPKKRIFFVSLAGALIAGLILATVVGAAGSPRQVPVVQVSEQRTQVPVQGLDMIEGIQNLFRQVAQNVLPVVVEIDVVDVIRQPVPESPFEFFFGPPGEERFFGPPEERKGPREREFRMRGLGSGLIVKKAGERVYVLTNNHVVGRAEEISVRLYDRREFKAKLVGRDPGKDLALVYFETKDQVPVAQLGNSDMVQVGDIVFAVGNPYGFQSTITMGIVSAVGRKTGAGAGVASFTDYIQTDAAINQGNSGGPLVNIKGEVVGINTWIASQSGGSIGLGFTVPINNAKRAVEDFVAKGKVEYGWLGINIGDLTPETQADLRIDGKRGAFVSSVFRGSPADDAGILPGDYITKVNGEPIEDTTHLLFTIANLSPGSTADFELVRYGQTTSSKVKIAVRKDDRDLQAQNRQSWPGMAVMHLTEDMQKRLDLPRKAGELIVAQVVRESPAGISGFRPGDIIKQIDGRDVKDAMEFYRVLNDKNTKEIMFRIYRQGNEFPIGLVR